MRAARSTCETSPTDAADQMRFRGRRPSTPPNWPVARRTHRFSTISRSFMRPRRLQQELQRSPLCGDARRSTRCRARTVRRRQRTLRLRGVSHRTQRRDSPTPLTGHPCPVAQFETRMISNRSESRTTRLQAAPDRWTGAGKCMGDFPPTSGLALRAV